MKLSLVTLDNRTAADKEFTKPRVVSGINIEVNKCLNKLSSL
jgi:hypothetical protein